MSLLDERAKITLLNEDCLPAMKGMQDNEFQIAIVDPPYGIRMSQNVKKGVGWVRKAKSWDEAIPSEEYFKELFRVSENQIIWGANYMVEYLPRSAGWIFWDKDQGEGFS